MTIARKTLGVLIDYVDYLSGGYECRLRGALRAEAQRHDADLFIFVGRPLRSPDYEAQNGVYQLAHTDRLDGLILVAAGLGTFTGVEGVRRLCERYQDLPLCSLGLDVPGVPSIVLDNRSGMAALVEHLLIEHGCRRIAYIGGPENNPDSLEREQIVSSVLARHGLPLDPAYVEQGLFTFPSGGSAMEAILTRVRDFDAVIAANDGMALGAREVLKAHRLQVPQQVRVVGFDDLDLARFASPPLTTVRQPLERMAELAIQSVITQISGEPVLRRTHVSAELVRRRSCGCKPAPEPRSLSASATALTSGLAAQADRLAARVALELPSLGDEARATALLLVRGLIAETEGEGGAFLAALESALDGSADQAELHDQLQEVISLLRAESAELGAPLEDVWHEARVLTARNGARANARQRMGVDVAYWHLLRSGERLLTAFDLSSLKAVLVEELPAMHVRNAVFSLYRDASRRELEPFLCLRDGVAVEPTVSHYPASQLVPPGTYADEGAHVSFVWPLAADLQQFGAAVLETPAEVGTLEMLGEQVSAALKSAALHREIVLRTAQHERALQERLASAKRMTALSVLAGGVAHDLNNSLGPLVALPDIILNELDELARSSPRDQTELRADITAIKSAALRAAETIRDLLTTARQGRTHKQVFDLNRAVRALVSADAHLLAPVEVSLDLCAEPLLLYGSESQVGRALTNLLRNAAEASKGVGRIRIETAVAQVSERLSGFETIERGEYVKLTVSDNGRGIPADEVSRVFEPFYTRKQPGASSGSGLGLAIVHGVVKEHDGFVNVDSAVDRGTTFTLYFQRSNGPQPARDEQRTSSRPSQARAGRILVVDDDPVQVRTAQRVLAQAGHQVTTADCGREVQERFDEAARRGEPSPFDLLILDMVLNEIDDGLVIFDRVLQLYPRQRGIIVSGHAPTERGMVAVERGLAWLGKPYTREALTEAVAAALTQSDEPGSPASSDHEIPPSGRQRRTGT